MDNVYERVRAYYEENAVWPPIIKKEWVEGYLRQKAWSGIKEKRLISTWRIIESLLQYLEYAGFEEIEELEADDWNEAADWIRNNVRQAEIKLLGGNEDLILDFIQFLVSKKYIAQPIPLEAGPTVSDHTTTANRNLTVNVNSGITTEELMTAVGDLVENLIARLGGYFQRAEFNDDFQRALFLYTGPHTTIPDEDDDFWLGFWDYFLFDYHLLRNDNTPIYHFYEKCVDAIPPGEQRILKDLLGAEFVVFFIERIINSEWVECRNLFTDEIFQLPHPDIDYRTFKKVLFFGHVFSKETILVNYVNTIEISARLRQRVKEEINKLKDLFSIQIQDLTWQEFLVHHALSVRHAIDVLTTRAIVNIIPFDTEAEEVPASNCEGRCEDKVSKLVSENMFEYGYSLHDINIALRLWYDYLHYSGGQKVKKHALWAAAIVFVYAQLNSPYGLAVSEVAEDFEVSAKSISEKRKIMFDTLKLKKYDPRYLSEEGCIFFLYTL